MYRPPNVTGSEHGSAVTIADELKQQKTIDENGYAVFESFVDPQDDTDIDRMLEACVDCLIDMMDTARELPMRSFDLISNSGAHIRITRNHGVTQLFCLVSSGDYKGLLGVDDPVEDERWLVPKEVDIVADVYQTIRPNTPGKLQIFERQCSVFPLLSKEHAFALQFILDHGCSAYKKIEGFPSYVPLYGLVHYEPSSNLAFMQGKEHHYDAAEDTLTLSVVKRGTSSALIGVHPSTLTKVDRTPGDLLVINYLAQEPSKDWSATHPERVFDGHAPIHDMFNEGGESVLIALADLPGADGIAFLNSLGIYSPYQRDLEVPSVRHSGRLTVDIDQQADVELRNRVLVPPRI